MCDCPVGGWAQADELVRSRWLGDRLVDRILFFKKVALVEVIRGDTLGITHQPVREGDKSEFVPRSSARTGWSPGYRRTATNLCSSFSAHAFRTPKYSPCQVGSVSRSIELCPVSGVQSRPQRVMFNSSYQSGASTAPPSSVVYTHSLSLSLSPSAYHLVRYPLIVPTATSPPPSLSTTPLARSRSLTSAHKACSSPPRSAHPSRLIRTGDSNGGTCVPRVE